MRAVIARCTTFAYVGPSDWNCLPHSLHLELLSHLSSCRNDCPVASLLYASPGWWGFTLAQDRDRLECMVGRLRWCGYLPESAPHLRNGPRRLTRAFSGQLHLTRVMFSAASFQGLSPLGTTCAHAPTYNCM